MHGLAIRCLTKGFQDKVFSWWHLLLYKLWLGPGTSPNNSKPYFLISYHRTPKHQMRTPKKTPQPKHIYHSIFTNTDGDLHPIFPFYLLTYFSRD